MAAAVPLSARLQAVVVRGLAALPDGVLRLLVGRPVVIDGQRLHVEAQLGVKLLALAGEPDLEHLTVADARARITADAATFEGPKVPVASASDMTVQGAEGLLSARLYIPHGDDTGSLLVYFHGGGFVVGDLETHDNLCRFIATRSGARVLAVDYRLAPEHPFPAPIDDAVAAFRDAAERASELGCDPSRIAVGGDSAGGNLAAGVARIAASEGGPTPAFQLLLYPWLDLASERRSQELFAEGFYLTRSDLHWYRDRYLTDRSQASDPRCSPIAGNVGGAAPAYIATAGFDPLRDDGEDYARRLREAGVPAALRRHEGMIHGFANTVAIGHAAREAMLEATGALRMALAA
ncbi:MAG TPA: alpha/beta hydrolase [Solirubrobacteraceae bacterium]|jgi:acetyl esterase